MRVEIGPSLRLAQRDTVLLASDGLFDNLFIDEIVDSIRTGPLVEAADRVVERVRARMNGKGANDQPCKPDDLTVVLFRPRRAAR
jgi:protein phosphatase